MSKYEIIGNDVDIVCPKCKSKDLILHEMYDSSEWFCVDNGIITHGPEPSVGNVLGVVATCKRCNHKWKLRNYNSVSDIILKNKLR